MLCYFFDASLKLGWLASCLRLAFRHHVSRLQLTSSAPAVRDTCAHHPEVISLGHFRTKHMSH